MDEEKLKEQLDKNMILIKREAESNKTAMKIGNYWVRDKSRDKTKKDRKT